MSKPILLPVSIGGALDEGAALVCSVSGGKDSDAMTLRLAEARQVFGWTGRWILHHQDCGVIEWPQSESHCRDMAARVGAEFVVSRMSQRELLAEIVRKWRAKPDVCPWPSNAARYCTAGWKRNVFDVWVRKEFPNNATVISAIGLRADESPTRARRDACSMRGASAASKNRMVIDWLPIHQFTLADVWETLLPGAGLKGLAFYRRIYQDWLKAHRRPGQPLDSFLDAFAKANISWQYHPAYVMGNERVSCALCPLASNNDLLIGATSNPKLYRALCHIELESGFTFKQNRPLFREAPDVLTEGQRRRVSQFIPFAQRVGPQPIKSQQLALFPA